MRVKEAKVLARAWVRQDGMKLAGCEGAFFHGSINWLTDDADLAPTSDLDVMLVFVEPPAVKLGKFVYNGLLLEISYLAWRDLPSAEYLLGTAHLAGSFQGGTIIADPTGKLATLEQVVAANYAKRRWVEERVANTEAKIRHHLSFDVEAPFHQQVMAWLFGTGVTTHLLLVAGLRNPTVRRRYGAVRTLLHDYGLPEAYEPLLALLGCAALDAPTVQRHLNTLAVAYDAAKQVIQSPFFFAADINDMSRAVAIDGSQELIDQGDHREAIFWIVATYARCMLVFREDAPHLLPQHSPGFLALLADLGIHNHADLDQRRTAVEEALPALRQLAAVVMAMTPEISMS